MDADKIIALMFIVAIFIAELMIGLKLDTIANLLR